MFSAALWILLLFQPPAQFVRVPAGVYTVGQPNSLQNPRRQVKTTGFDISATELTNAAFAEFVAATGYVTDAERFKNALVFEPGLAEFRWLEDSTASWRHPNGVSRGNCQPNHPVTTISYHDAEAYCQWANVRLPTLDEWEIASRAGAATLYHWGNGENQLRTYANIWHGRFPERDRGDDGFAGTSPVTAFPANGFGLYDMGGNVWQWCADWYRPDVYASRPQNGAVTRNPHGPADSYDPNEAGAAKRVVRGGDFRSEASGIRAAFRASMDPSRTADFSNGDIGFRCAREVTP